MSKTVPDHKTDPDLFNAWSMMYLDRALSADKEQAFEAVLASNSEASAAFARVCEMDTNLFENSEVVAVAPRTVRTELEAELLDPKNAADLEFISQVCRVLNESPALRKVEKIPARRQSVSVLPAKRAASFWRPLALAWPAAAIVLITAAYYFIVTPRHEPVARQTVPPIQNPQPDMPDAEFSLKNNNAESRGVVAHGDEPDSNVLSPLTRPDNTESEATLANGNVTDVKKHVVRSAQPGPNNDLVEASDPDHVPQEPKRTQPRSVKTIALGVNAETSGRQLDDTGIWRATGDVMLRRTATRTEIPLKMETNDNRWHLGGQICMKTFDVEKGTPYLRMTVESSVLRSPAIDLEFIITNQASGGKIVPVSVRPQEMEKLSGKIDVNARRHTYEIVIRRFNQYEIRIDGHSVYFHTEPLTRGEWEEMCLGFRAACKGNVDAETIIVEDVSIGYGDARK
jgi:hypothetical protein